MSAFQESNDQSGKPDGGEKWQDKIFAAHVQKNGGGRVGGGTVTTQRMVPQVDESCGQLNLLMTTVIPEL